MDLLLHNHSNSCQNREINIETTLFFSLDPIQILSLISVALYLIENLRSHVGYSCHVSFNPDQFFSLLSFMVCIHKKILVSL